MIDLRVSGEGTIFLNILLNYLIQKKNTNTKIVVKIYLIINLFPFFEIQPLLIKNL
jgi:hypothetical protein